MNEKRPPLPLRWPWNVAIWVVLALVLRLFAIPLIALMVWAQGKYSPHGAAEGYCLSRTRKRLTWLAWGLLSLAIGASLAVLFRTGLSQDRAYWETMDYVTLVFSGGGGLLFLGLGVYAVYTAVRDVFFPGKSALAQSIRDQLPYPDEAPPVSELFAMVDGDLKEHGQWFGPVGVGQEWVLGDVVTRIDRIRGIFTVDEIHQHHTKTGVRTSRTLELVLIDDRWQRGATTFRDPQDLRAAADCLALRVPDARRGVNDQYITFWKLDESGREEFERTFRQKRDRRASEQAQSEMLSDGPQDMILRTVDGEVTSRVTLSLAEEQLRTCLDRGEGRFVLTPGRPIGPEGRAFRALHVSVAEGTVWLLAELQDQPGYGPARALPEREARETLALWLRRGSPDTSSWELRRVYDPSSRQEPKAPERKSHARLSLVYASGAAENHTTFTREDVQVAAEGIADGTYQLVDLTHPAGYLWIRVTAGDKSDGRCTVEATRPEGPELGFYAARMSPRQAASWLTGYPKEPFLPGGEGWRRIRKPS